MKVQMTHRKPVIAALVLLAGMLIYNAAYAQATSDPIPDPILKSGIAVELENWLTVPRSGSRSTDTHADINFIYPAFDGSSDLYTVDVRGVIWRIHNGEIVTPAFLDLRTARAEAFYVSHVRSTGLRSFAFHPDCGRDGRPGNCKFYTAHSETVESAPANTRLFEGGFDKPILYHNVIAEWSVDLSGQPSVDLSSRRELLRVEQRAKHHNLDQLMFDPNAEPGDADYGLMWITLGDGISKANDQDPDDQAENPQRLLGKVARINPLKSGSLPYTVPASNPFFNTPDYLPEIWALGFRHPQNISFDTGGSGQILMIDIGENMVEEVNLGVPGADYGWPERQGTFVNDRQNEFVVYPLPAIDSSLGYTYPVAQFDHDEGFAAVGGYVYRGNDIPELVGHYLFGDIVKGRVFHVPVSEFHLGSQAEIKELTLLFNGVEMTLPEAVGRSRADLRFGIDTEDELVISSKQSGQIWRVRRSGFEPPLDLLIAPDGDIDDRTPEFSWQSLALTETYRLKITGGSSPVAQTLSAGELGCSTEGEICRFEGLTLEPGRYDWEVLAIDATEDERNIGRNSFTVADDINDSDFSPRGSITDSQPEFSWPFALGAVEFEVTITKSTDTEGLVSRLTTAESGCGALGDSCRFRDPIFPQGAYDWSVRYRTVADGPWMELGTANFTLTVPVNTPPTVNAGSDIAAYINIKFLLNGSVSDDGPVTASWSVVQAEGGRVFPVKILSPSSPAQMIKVTRIGTYVLRLTADDGSNQVFDEVTLTIVNQGSPLPDPEPGPDPDPDPDPDPTGDSPTVNAGQNIAAHINTRFLLPGSVTNDGAVTSLWSVVQAENGNDWAVKILSPESPSQLIKVTRTGSYVLRLTADNGDKQAFDEVTLTIVDQGTPLPDPDPDPGPGPGPGPGPDPDPDPDPGPSDLEVDAGVDINATLNQKFLLSGTASTGSAVTWRVAFSSYGRIFPVKLQQPDVLTQRVKITRTGEYILELSATKDGVTVTDTTTVTVR